MAGNTVTINRAPVLTLWAAVVAERLGYDWDEALTLGKCVAGLNAQAKGRRLGIYTERPAPEGGGKPKKGLGEEFWVEVCGRPVPARQTENGVRAVVGGDPIDPASVARYLRSKFKEALDDVLSALRALARAYDADTLEGAAYELYEKFRPEIPPGRAGWGRAGELDLDLVRRLADRA